MKIQAEVSLYPLRQATLSEAIYRFVEDLRADGLTVEMGTMSTHVSGECRALFAALGRAFETAAAGGAVVAALKVTNAFPVVEPHREQA